MRTVETSLKAEDEGIDKEPQGLKTAKTFVTANDRKLGKKIQRITIIENLAPNVVGV